MRLHQLDGAEAQLAHRLMYHGIAVLVEHVIQASCAQVQRGQLAVEVAPQAVGQAGVGLEDGQHIVIKHPGAHDAHGRDLHRLLPAFGGRRVVVAGHVAAHIVPMRGGCQKTIQLALAKKRPHQLEVVGVRTAFVGVVEQPGVAVDDAATLGSGALGRAYRKGHGAYKYRQSGLALHQRVAALGVVQAVAGVVRLGNDGVERAAVQRGVHLVGNLLQSAAQDRQRDGVHCGRRHLRCRHLLFSHEGAPCQNACATGSANRRCAPCPLKMTVSAHTQACCRTEK